MMVQSLGVRIIVPERPGYGISDSKPDRELIDWSDDIAELADHHGSDSFAVEGESGGPHAVACAYLLTERPDVIEPLREVLRGEAV